MAKQYDLMVRVLLVGDSGVGKTCLLCKYVDNEYYPSYSATIGIDFKVKQMTLQNRRIRVQIWDTAGQERFETITKQYYRRAQGALLVYDITNEASFRHIVKWMAYIRQFGPEDIEMTLVGNKTDLKEERAVSREEALKFAQNNGLAFFETSAYTDTKINLIYEDLVSRIMLTQTAQLELQQVDSMPSDTESDVEFQLQARWAQQRSKSCCS